MDTIDAIKNRRSVRNYSEREITEEAVRLILQAGMSGPSCVNAKDWFFVAVRNPEMLNRMADANGPYAAPLKRAKLGILVCGDLSRAFAPAPEYWVIDGAIAAQNMILAAESIGIGSVWLGTWPQMERVKAQAELFELPEHIVPHSVLAFGYPAQEAGAAREKEWLADRVHFEKFGKLISVT